MRRGAELFLARGGAPLSERRAQISRRKQTPLAARVWRGTARQEQLRAAPAVFEPSRGTARQEQLRAAPAVFEPSRGTARQEQLRTAPAVFEPVGGGHQPLLTPCGCVTGGATRRRLWALRRRDR